MVQNKSQWTVEFSLARNLHWYYFPLMLPTIDEANQLADELEAIYAVDATRVKEITQPSN